MSAKDNITALRRDLRNLNAAMPETAKAFGGLGKAVKEGGVLEFKHKEYVALGIAIATKCADCILLHTEALARVGAAREEIADVCAMSVQMGGGPSLMYASKAMAYFDEFAAERAASAAR